MHQDTQLAGCVHVLLNGTASVEDVTNDTVQPYTMSSSRRSKKPEPIHTHTHMGVNNCCVRPPSVGQHDAREQWGHEFTFIHSHFCATNVSV